MAFLAVCISVTVGFFNSEQTYNQDDYHCSEGNIIVQQQFPVFLLFVVTRHQCFPIPSAPESFDI